jgi:hypothetical protein
MNDTFEFSADFDLFPEDLPRKDWQTKSLDCAMADYWVASDGLVARRQFLSDGYFASNTASFTAYLFHFRKGVRLDLKVVVARGRILELRREREPEAGKEVDEWTVPVQGPDAEYHQ